MVEAFAYTIVEDTVVKFVVEVSRTNVKLAADNTYLRHQMAKHLGEVLVQEVERVLTND